MSGKRGVAGHASDCSSRGQEADIRGTASRSPNWSYRQGSGGRSRRRRGLASAADTRTLGTSHVVGPSTSGSLPDITERRSRSHRLDERAWPRAFLHWFESGSPGQALARFDTLHRYPIHPLLGECLRVAAPTAPILFPHDHLTNSEPEPFFERGCSQRHGREWSSHLSTVLEGDPRRAWVLSEPAAFDRSAELVLADDPNTADSSIRRQPSSPTKPPDEHGRRPAPEHHESLSRDDCLRPLAAGRGRGVGGRNPQYDRPHGHRRWHRRVDGTRPRHLRTRRRAHSKPLRMARDARRDGPNVSWRYTDHPVLITSRQFVVGCGTPSAPARRGCHHPAHLLHLGHLVVGGSRPRCCIRQWCSPTGANRCRSRRGIRPAHPTHDRT